MDDESAIVIVIALAITFFLSYSVYNIKSCVVDTDEARINCLEAGGSNYDCCLHFSNSKHPEQECASLAPAEKN